MRNWCCVVLGACTSAIAAEPMLLGLGDLPGGSVFSTARAVSRDGLSVVGVSNSASSSQVDRDKAFVWTLDDGMRQLASRSSSGLTRANALSNDRSLIVGAESPSGGGPAAVRWLGGGQNEPIRFQPLRNGAEVSNAMSADGTIIVGQRATSGAVKDAFRWTAETGIESIGRLFAGPVTQTSAEDISADGRVIVGKSANLDEGRAFRWSELTGTVSLGRLEDAGSSFAATTNIGGSVVAGWSDSTAGRQAMRWTEASGMVGLGDLPGGTYRSEARGMDDSGNVIVGRAEGALGPEAFVWTPTRGMRSLADVLTADLGIDLAGWRIHAAEDISADGRTIVGFGVNPSGQTEAFIAVIPAPGSGLMLGLGALACRRRR